MRRRRHVARYADHVIANFDHSRESLEGEFETYSADSKFHANTLFLTRGELAQRLWHAEKKLNAEGKGQNHG